MSILLDSSPAPPRRLACKPDARPVRNLPSSQADRGALLRAHREVALRMIANDLRRLAQDLDKLEESDELPVRLGTLVGAVMAAIGRPAPPLGIAPIAEAVCAAFRVTHDELVSRRRGQHVALARQVAIYLSREVTDYSFPRIGEYFNRDHSTAIHSHAQIARRVAAEASFRTLLIKLKNTLASQLASERTSLPSAAAAPADQSNLNRTMELCR